MNQQHKMNFKKMKMITAIHMHRRLYMHVSMHPKMINNYLILQFTTRPVQIQGIKTYGHFTYIHLIYTLD